MDDQIHGLLSRWSNFYLITGTAAATLTGLQFIVQTLLTSNLIRPVSGRDPEGGIAAFGTPTVVHFTIALVISAMLCAPWSARSILRAMLIVIGAGALVYSLIVLRHARRQSGYAPEAEDWLWHIILPALAYAGILFAGVQLDSGDEWPLFSLASATLLLICVGIHNAWDTVTYLTLNALRADASQHTPAAPHRSAPVKRKRNRR